MNKYLLIILAAAASFLFAGCRHHHNEEPEPERARRTILVYMAAQNTLSGYDTSDLNEMRQARIPADCRLLVFRSTYNADPELIEIAGGEMKPLLTYPEGTIGADAETLKRVLADARKLAPAHENGIIFWSHSSGWKGAVKAPAANRSFGLEYGRQIELPDLADALLTVPTLDFVFFDSCYMGCVEVAYELRHTARYLVASPCEVPADGMPYNQTLPALFDRNLTAGLTEAIDLTVDHYLASPRERCPSTLTLVNLSEMDGVATSAAPLLANQIEPADDFQYLSITVPYNKLFVDLRHYMDVTTDNPETFRKFSDALERAVIHERHTLSIWDRIPIEHCCGLSINPEPDSDDYGYRNLAWTKATTL